MDMAISDNIAKTISKAPTFGDKDIFDNISKITSRTVRCWIRTPLILLQILSQGLKVTKMLNKDTFDIITNTISRSQGHQDVGQGHL